MAITTLDGLLAGMKPPESFFKISGTMEAVGVHHSHFYSTGRPGAAVAPTPGLAGEALTSYAGQIPFVNPTSNNTYLARFAAAASQTGTLILCDRLWHNSGIAITTTTGQTINSVAWPARDRNGATNGDDVLVAIEVSTATGNAAQVTNTTLTYTDESGNGSATATMNAFPLGAALGSFIPFQLAAGDTGVRSIQTLTLGTSYVSGTIHLVAYRTLAAVESGVNRMKGGILDAITSGFVRLYDNTVPFLLMMPTGGSTLAIQAQIIYTQG